jgi:hypothetical protein
MAEGGGVPPVGHACGGTFMQYHRAMPFEVRGTGASE